MIQPHRPDRFPFTARAAWTTLVVVALLLLPCAPAFAEAPSPAPSSGGKTTLRIGLLEDADNLNPYLGYQVTSYLMWHLNYDYLVGFDPKTLEPRPEVAESWTSAPDG